MIDINVGTLTICVEQLSGMISRKQGGTHVA